MMADAVRTPPLAAKDLPANALAGQARRLPVPAAALGPWLADIDDLVELKVTLRAVALLADGVSRRGIPPSLAPETLADDPFLAGAGIGDDGIRAGLAAALRRGTLAAVRAGGGIRIFLNDDDARRYFERAELTPVVPSDRPANAPDVTPADTAPTPAGRANIFALYERHIGTFGPQRADELQAAEEEYPAKWIEYAFATAAEHNARSWSYVNSILRRLVRDGLPEGTLPTYDDGKSGIDSETNRRAEYLEQYRRLFGQLPWESGEAV